MATIVQPYDPWREQLAASILGPLVGNMIQKGQEAEQNRKSNAFLSELQNRMNAVQEPLTGQWISTLPDIFSKNDFTLGFDKDLRPWANSFFDNGDLPQMNMNATAAAPSALRADQIRAMADQILGTNRFSMLDPQKARTLVDPYLQEAEKARREGQLADIAGSFTGAADDAARRNALWSGAIQGLVDPSMLGAFQKQIEADRPQPFSANLGGSWLFGNRDPNTGAITPNAQFPVTMTPYQAGQTAIEQARFNSEQDYRNWQMANPQMSAVTLGGKMYLTDGRGNFKPLMIDGQHMSGGQGQGALTPDWGTQFAINQIGDRIKGLEEQKKALMGTVISADDLTPELKQQITAIDSEINGLRQQQGVIAAQYVMNPTAMQYFGYGAQPESGPVDPRFVSNGSGAPAQPQGRQMGTLGTSDNIALNMVPGGKQSSGFGARWGKNHDGLDIAAAEGTPIMTPDFGAPMTVSEVVTGNPASGYGNYVVLTGTDSMGRPVSVKVAHMKNGSLNLKVGETLKPGDVIGQVGNTGRTKGGNDAKATDWYEGKPSGHHAHIEVRVNGKLVDPEKYLAAVKDEAKQQEMEEMRQGRFPQDWVFAPPFMAEDGVLFPGDTQPTAGSGILIPGDTVTSGDVLIPGDSVVSGDIRPEAPQAAGLGDIPGDLMYDAKRDANTPPEKIVSQQQFKAMMAAADRGDFKSKNINNAQEFIANAQRTGWRVK